MFVMFVGDNLVFWKSKKQLVVACLIAKAEYRAMALSVCRDDLVGIHIGGAQDESSGPDEIVV
jgi:surface antigen